MQTYLRKLFSGMLIDSPASKGSKVKLTANDGLVLASPNGDMLWNTEGLGDRVSHGVFNDTRNSVLEDGELNSLWETFKLPSELLLQNDGNLVMHFVNLPFGYVNENENYYESVKLWDPVHQVLELN